MKKKIKDPRKKRYLRGRKKALGTEQRPRLCLHRSLNHLRAQLIDDVNGKTILSVSTLEKEIKKDFKSGGNIAASKALGELLVKKAQAAKVAQVRFDRSGYQFHGRIKSFAEACKKNGLQF